MKELTNAEYEEFIAACKQLYESFKPTDMQGNLDSLKNELADGSLWQDDPKVAQDLNQKMAAAQKIQDQLTTFTETIENLGIALELQDEDQVHTLYSELEKQRDELEKQRYLDGKFDQRGCLFTIHAGAGGIDAQDWASMLTSMYQAFAKNQNWKVEIINLSLGDEGGVKSAALEINGPFAYGLLKEEAGVHRLVRLSPFNSGHTRETSFALVEVIPSDLHEDIDDLEIIEDDLKWDTFMSSGKGGQSVNTTYSAVRVTHIPTGITVSCQNERNQIQNRNMALKYLKTKLAARRATEMEELKGELRGEFHSAEWGNQIRNYVLHPYKLVKDTRSGWETNDVENVLENGEILDIIWSVKQADQE
jgi:peptide chain release factor 2